MGALTAAVSGLKVHQTMLDVAGNNLANVNTVGFKSQSTTFSELLSQTLRKASSPSDNLGGINPQQIGSGVGIASINRNMTQGNFLTTGSDLDAAIEGEGFFVLKNGEGQNLYTRIGSFGVDESFNLVDTATGFKVQRIGNFGAEFQASGTDISIPSNAPMAANATSVVTLEGNLSKSSAGDAADLLVRNRVESDTAFTTNGSTQAAVNGTFLDDIDGFSGTIAGAASTFTVNLTDMDGNAQTVTVDVTDATSPGGMTLGGLLDAINADANMGDTSVSLESGKLVFLDDAGYSQTRINSIDYTRNGTGDDAWADLGTINFDLVQPGANDSHAFSTDIYDSMGTKHTMTGTFVKTDTANVWDLYIPQIDGEEISSADNGFRKIEGIQFDAATGTYDGLVNPSTSLTIDVTFADNPTVTQTIAVDLGTPGVALDGLTQNGNPSNASATLQDGYSAGILDSVSLSNTGMVIGTFTNGKTITIAALQMATFQNAAALEAVGGGYFAESANSGAANETIAASNGAGSLNVGKLEQSNADIATEFVNLMKAQNGYQSNARTIRIANDVLRELTNLIR